MAKNVNVPIALLITAIDARFERMRDPEGWYAIPTVATWLDVNEDVLEETTRENPGLFEVRAGNRFPEEARVPRKGGGYWPHFRRLSTDERLAYRHKEQVAQDAAVHVQSFVLQALEAHGGTLPDGLVFSTTWDPKAKAFVITGLSPELVHQQVHRYPMAEDRAVDTDPDDTAAAQDVVDAQAEQWERDVLRAAQDTLDEADEMEADEMEAAG